jgi:hypothetical protein
MIAATKDGIAADTAVTTTVPVSSSPGRNPDTRPRPMPITMMMIDA